MQSRKEELWNTWTHAFGILMSCIAMFYLVPAASSYHDFYKTASVLIFGFGTIFLYTASTIYHAVTEYKTKKRYQIFDHIGIFLIIGGSYTPFVQHCIEPKLATQFLGAMWLIIALGIIKKIFFTGRFEWLSVSVYLFLGWMILFIYEPITIKIPASIFQWIVYGGISYTVGIVFYLWEKLKFHHVIWHFFVLFGTFCHILALYLLLTQA